MRSTKKWILNVRREATVFAGAGMTYAFGISKRVGIPFQYQNVRYVDFEWWFSADEFDELNHILSGLFRQDRPSYEQIIGNQFTSGERLKDHIRALDGRKFADLQLKDTYDEYLEKLLEFYSFYVFPTVAGDIVENEVKTILQDLPIDLELSELVYPDKPLDSNKGRIELLEIGQDPIFNTASAFKELDDRTKRRLEKHVKRYGWESYSFHIGTMLTPQDYFRMIKEENDCAGELTRYADQEKERVANERRLKSLLTEDAFGTIKILQKIIYFRNYQKETMNECQFRSIPFLSTVADRLGITFSELQMLSPFEISDALAGSEIDVKNIGKRRETFKVVLNDGILEIAADRTRSKKGKGMRRFSGQIACKGKVEGTARIIMNKEDLMWFNDGEILVTSMTSVDSIGAVRKAKAIITDEGGVTCHAAIFSREYDIPCIIGTKIATKALNTGDRVEVDANHGLVTILD